MKPINCLVIAAFLFSSIIGPSPEVGAQNINILTPPGAMVDLSGPYAPLQLRGIQVYPKNPLRFDFLIDKGESGLTGRSLNDEVTRLTKYFLTCLTVPETDVWVNLSPYEKNRIAPDNFGITQMGRDLLEQDYLLKQITASLSYPDSELGKRFWQKVYEKAYALYGTTEIPVNSFNKVWIVPKSADVYVHGTSAFVAHSELDVMLDTDYLALMKNRNDQALDPSSQVYTQTVRDVILPILRKEVNEGKNFAVVRQVYQAMILAAWYKRHLKNGFLGKEYVRRNKVKGVDVADKNVKEEIFQQYLKAFKKKVYNYIKEDYDPLTQETIPRKYVSGGFSEGDFGQLADTRYKEDGSMSAMKFSPNLAMADIDLSVTSNGKLFSFSRNDPSMIAAIGNIVKGKFLSIMLLAAAAGVMAPALKAAEITPNVAVAQGIDQNRRSLDFHDNLHLNSEGQDVKEKGLALLGHVNADDIRNLAGQYNSVNTKSQYSEYLAKHADGVIQGAQKSIQKGVFDRNVERVVVAFQHAHHLAEDGTIGKQVITELNSLDGVSTLAVGSASVAGGASGGGAPPGGPPPEVVSVQSVPLPAPAPAAIPLHAHPSAITLPSAIPAATMAPIDVVKSYIGDQKTEGKLIGASALAQRNKAAGASGTIITAGFSANLERPQLNYIGPMVTVSRDINHPTAKSDARMEKLAVVTDNANALDKLRDNLFAKLLPSLSELYVLRYHRGRLEFANNQTTIGRPGLNEEILKAKRDEQHLLVQITILLEKSLKDIPSQAAVMITDVLDQDQQDQINGLLSEAAAAGIPGAQQAALNFANVVETARGAKETSHKVGVNLSVGYNPVQGIAAGVSGQWWLALINPSLKIYPKFDVPKQAAFIESQIPLILKARLDAKNELTQALLDLQKYQEELNTANETWAAASGSWDDITLEEASRSIEDLELKIATAQLQLGRYQMSVSPQEAVAASADDLAKKASRHVKEGFVAAVESYKEQVEGLTVQMDRDKKHVKDNEQVKTALGKMKDAMGNDINDKDGMAAAGITKDIKGNVLPDISGGAEASKRSAKITPPTSFPVGKTSGHSTYDSEGSTISDYDQTGQLTFQFIIQGGTPNGTALTKSLDTAKKNFDDAVKKGDTYGMAINRYIGAQIGRELQKQGRVYINGPTWWQRSTTQDFVVLSIESINAVTGVKKIYHVLHKPGPTPESMAAGDILVEQSFLFARQAMVDAMKDASHGEQWKFWESFFKMGREGQLDKFQSSFYEKNEPIWNGGQPPPQDSLDLQVLELQLKAAEHLMDSAPPKVTTALLAPYWALLGSINQALRGNNANNLYGFGIRGNFGYSRKEEKDARQDARMEVAAARRAFEELKTAEKEDRTALQGAMDAAKTMEHIRTMGHSDVTQTKIKVGDENKLAALVIAGLPAAQQLEVLKGQTRQSRALMVNAVGYDQFVKPSPVDGKITPIGGVLVSVNTVIKDGGVNAARKNAVAAATAVTSHDLDAQRLAVPRRIHDLIDDQEYAAAAYQRNMNAYDQARGRQDATAQLLVDGLLRRDEFDKIQPRLKRDVEHAYNRCLEALKRFNVAKMQLENMVPEKERKEPFVTYEEVKIEPPSLVDLSAEDSVNFYAHILGRDIVRSIDEPTLTLIRVQLSKAKVSKEELDRIIVDIYRVPGPPLTQDDLPGRQEYLRSRLAVAIEYVQKIKTGPIPPVIVQPSLEQSAAAAPVVLPVDKPGDPQSQAGYLVRNFIGKPITLQDIKSIQAMLEKAGVSEFQFNEIIADLYSMGMGKDVTAKKITERVKKIRLNLLLQNLPQVIEKVTGRPVKDKAMLKNPGGIDMNNRLLDLREHSDGNSISVFDEKTLELIPIDGVSPRVLEFVPVTPGMLKALLEK